MHRYVFGGILLCDVVRGHSKTQSKLLLEIFFEIDKKTETPRRAALNPDQVQSCGKLSPGPLYPQPKHLISRAGWTCRQRNKVLTVSTIAPLAYFSMHEKPHCLGTFLWLLFILHSSGSFAPRRNCSSKAISNKYSKNTLRDESHAIKVGLQERLCDD